MQEALILYASTALIFLGVDSLGLRFLVAPAFRKQLGDAMLDAPRLGPAAAFYLFFVAGIVFFVSIPSMDSGGPARAFWMGAFLGALAYGTYEFTNLATLKRWSWKLVLTDGLWGTALTGVAAAGGVWITRAVL